MIKVELHAESNLYYLYTMVTEKVNVILKLRGKNTGRRCRVTLCLRMEWRVVSRAQYSIVHSSAGEQRGLTYGHTIM